MRFFKKVNNSVLSRRLLLPVLIAVGGPLGRCIPWNINVTLGSIFALLQLFYSIETHLRAYDRIHLKRGSPANKFTALATYLLALDLIFEK